MAIICRAEGEALLGRGGFVGESKKHPEKSTLRIHLFICQCTNGRQLLAIGNIEAYTIL